MWWMGSHSRVLVIVIFAALPSMATDAKGWYRSYCDGAEIHLTTFPNSSKGEELQLSLRTSFPSPPPEAYWTQPDLWMDDVAKVTGRRCKKAGKCDEATHTDFRVMRQTKSKLFGKYRIDFGDQQLDGEFSVHYRAGPLHICE
jgi:hypothetical protein